MLGDYVDRGPSSRQLIERLLGWDDPAFHLIALKGNHEAMMWECCHGLLEAKRWLGNGGGATLASYGIDNRADPRGAVPHAHLDWLEHLPLLHADAQRVYVHAGVDPAVPLGRQTAATLLWKRYASGFKIGHGALHVVHGHDANEAAPLVTAGRSNLDGLAWKTGRLVVGIFEDGRSGAAIDYITITGAPAADPERP